MKVESTFPIEMFVFKNKDIDNAALIKKLEAIDGVDIKKTTTLSFLYDLRKNSNFKDLFDWFDQCLEEIRVAMKYDCDKIAITNSWFNVALGGYNMHQNYHRHSMSFFSGIYYLTNGSPTVFEDPVYQRSHAQIEVLRHEYTPVHVSEAEPGKLVIFPSWMYHNSRPHIEEYNRYIISFNTMPSGKINFNLASDSTAEIEIK